MKLSTLAILYFALAALGLVATWYFNIHYILSGGTFAPADFARNAFANALASSITLDIYIAAIVFSVWVFTEARKLTIRWPWLYIILTFGVALAFSFPLFLAIREMAIAKNSYQ